jgi:hypothetical protein
MLAKRCARGFECVDAALADGGGYMCCKGACGAHGSEHEDVPSPRNGSRPSLAHPSLTAHDKIWNRGRDWDAVPIVLEEHKLLLFTVRCPRHGEYIITPLRTLLNAGGAGTKSGMHSS